LLNNSNKIKKPLSKHYKKGKNNSKLNLIRFLTWSPSREAIKMKYKDSSRLSNNLMRKVKKLSKKIRS